MTLKSRIAITAMFASILAVPAGALAADNDWRGHRMGQFMGGGDGDWRGRMMMRGNGPGGRFMERFGIVDANDDSRISDDEAAAQQEAVFLAMDADDSGDLTEEEFMAVRMGPGEGRNQERRKAREDEKKARFAAMDADKSGTATKAEFMAAGKARFEAADSDKDGIVTPWEFRAHRN